MEMMIVVGIIAIVAAIATPSTMAWLRRQGVRNAADKLAEDFQRAKLLAIQRSDNCSLTIDTGNNQYTISLINETIDLAGFRGEVTFTDTPLATDTLITFSPQGVCNPAGAVLLTNAEGSATYRVRATAAGGISRHRWLNGSWQ
jgi:Tfp pilus assembly protein FimT